MNDDGITWRWDKENGLWVASDGLSEGIGDTKAEALQDLYGAIKRAQPRPVEEPEPVESKPKAVTVSIGGKPVDWNSLPPADSEDRAPRVGYYAPLEQDAEFQAARGTTVKHRHGRIVWHRRGVAGADSHKHPLDAWMGKKERRFKADMAKVQRYVRIVLANRKRKEAQHAAILCAAEQNAHLGPRLSKHLAERFGVSRRTIQRILKQRKRQNKKGE